MRAMEFDAARGFYPAGAAGFSVVSASELTRAVPGSRLGND